MEESDRKNNEVCVLGKTQNKDDAAIIFVIIVSVLIVLASICFHIVQDYYLIGNLLLFLYSVPFMITVGFLWYLLVLSLFMLFLPAKAKLINKRDKYNFAFLIAVLSSFIDFAYRRLIWYDEFSHPPEPLINFAFQLALILVPMFLYFLSSSTLSRSTLKMDKRQSVILGLTIALLNTSWLELILPQLVKIS